MDMNNRILVVNSVDEVVARFGKPYLTPEELKASGYSHILVRGSGYLMFSMLLDRTQMFELVEKKFSNIIQERLEGYRGVYGYIGITVEMIDILKRTGEYNEDGKKLYFLTVEYEGPHFIVNSGTLSGMVLINSNFQKINFKSIINS